MLNPIIAGIDEAGRGALAGPVVAAACVIRSSLIPRKTPCISWSPVRTKRQQGFCLIADSKKLTPEQRESSFAWIKKNCLFGIGMSSADHIDRHGILAATERAMQEAIRALAQIITPTYLLVDGRDKFWFDYPHTSIIRGDESESCIAAASIVAKVTRDRLMIASAKEFPQFGFERHKGYGTNFITRRSAFICRARSIVVRFSQMPSSSLRQQQWKEERGKWIVFF